MKDLSLIKSLLLLLLVTFVIGGCATSRSIVDIRIDTGQNPVDGKAVRIEQINDIRKFEVAPKTQSIPSLSQEEINDTKIISRVIGRKRNTYGKALGDFMLPEQRTVQDLIREAMTRALREKGYSVVEKSSADYLKTSPLVADINQLWAYMTPGFWNITLEAETIITVKGDVFPASGGEKIRGYGRMEAQTGMESNYIEVIQNSLEDFIRNLKQALK